MKLELPDYTDQTFHAISLNAATSHAIMKLGNLKVSYDTKDNVLLSISLKHEDVVNLILLNSTGGLWVWIVYARSRVYDICYGWILRQCL